ncbi:MAG: hypothetical protein AAGI17_06530 [Planctomycetota bacterium]
MPADRAIAFALYTAHDGVLKMTAQLYPLAEGVDRTVMLEVRPSGSGSWRTVGEVEVDESSYGWPQENRKRWLAHFRVEDWDQTRDFDYRLVAASGRATYQGRVRRDPVEKDVIVVASLSCNSNADRGPREDIVRNLQHQDPDLLFFAGDQSYDHKKHLEAWLLFGRQFGELMRDRPTVTIPDDHDIGQGNLWGEGGIKANTPDGEGGGYFHSAQYIRSVETAQTWHLPDPYDARPIAQGIGVYYTSLHVGGIDFAVIEDRKFKTGPRGLIRSRGPRRDEAGAQSFDPAVLDVPEAQLLGRRQLDFLTAWSADWDGAEMKAVLSQTVFGNAAHRSGPGLWDRTLSEVDLSTERSNRQRADLDSNGWPQTGRNKAVEAIRRGFATHLCGDQHLATLVHHGINEYRDSMVSFASPSIVNYFVRWWDPLEDAVDPLAGELENLGGYRDALGNKLTMLAYVNPQPGLVLARDDEGEAWGERAEGYGLVHFDKASREITYEVWPRYIDVTSADAQPYPGWPVTVSQMDNYGREPMGWLPTIEVTGEDEPVFELIHEGTGELVYAIRANEPRMTPHVFDASATYTVKVSGHPGRAESLSGIKPKRSRDGRVIRVDLGGGR